MGKVRQVGDNHAENKWDLGFRVQRLGIDRV